MSKSGNSDGAKGPQAKPALSDEVKEEIRGMLIHGVGYKRPPQGTQFKKGQSGNPKGRPKRKVPDVMDSSLDALVLSEAKRMVTIRENGETREVSAVEGVVRSHLASALKGSPYAQRYFLDRYGAADQRNRLRIQEDVELFERYVAIKRKEIDDAIRNGETPPTALPHPDDIVIDHERGIRIIGPMNEEDLMRFEQSCELRDILLLQHAFDEREADDEPGAMLMAIILNDRLPARMRLADEVILMRMMKHAALTKRVLLKRLYRGWRALGCDVPRGTVFPGRTFVRARLEFYVDLISAAINGEIDLDAMASGEFDANAQRILAEHAA